MPYRRRSWLHDWKSCRRQKRLEGSNPSFSAKAKTLSTDAGRVFALAEKVYIISSSVLYRYMNIVS